MNLDSNLLVSEIIKCGHCYRLFVLLTNVKIGKRGWVLYIDKLDGKREIRMNKHARC